jgi:Rps23 Pro-64 3,4-dihydroxylase Tpa1-like proline 4-hydroxylase
MTIPPFAFNPRLDLPLLAKGYALKGRLQVRDVFTEATAEAVLAMLERETPWGLAFNDGNRVVQLDAAQCARLSVADRQRIGAGVMEGAREGYQFIYSLFPLLQAYFDPRAPRLPLFAVFEWLNSPVFLDFARRLTGLEGIVWTDAQATMFGAGQFLKYHTDETPSQQRLAAYVINLTKGWGRDWGGFLQFFDEKYDVEEALRPVFNAINIFTVPADHSVSVVAPYVQRGRLAITGWLRGDQPPRPIGGR